MCFGNVQHIVYSTPFPHSTSTSTRASFMKRLQDLYNDDSESLNNAREIALYARQ